MQKLRRFDGCKNSITSRSTRQLKKKPRIISVSSVSFCPNIERVPFVFLLNRETCTSKRLEDERVMKRGGYPHIYHYTSFIIPKFEGREGGKGLKGIWAPTSISIVVFKGLKLARDERESPDPRTAAPVILGRGFSWRCRHGSRRRCTADEILSPSRGREGCAPFSGRFVRTRISAVPEFGLERRVSATREKHVRRVPSFSPRTRVAKEC